LLDIAWCSSPVVPVCSSIQHIKNTLCYIILITTSISFANNVNGEQSPAQKISKEVIEHSGYGVIR